MQRCSSLTSRTENEVIPSRCDTNNAISPCLLVKCIFDLSDQDNDDNYPLKKRKVSGWKKKEVQAGSPGPQSARAINQRNM